MDEITYHSPNATLSPAGQLILRSSGCTWVKKIYCKILFDSWTLVDIGPKGRLTLAWKAAHFSFREEGLNIDWNDFFHLYPPQLLRRQHCRLSTFTFFLMMRRAGLSTLTSLGGRLIYLAISIENVQFFSWPLFTRRTSRLDDYQKNSSLSDHQVVFTIE